MIMNAVNFSLSCNGTSSESHVGGELMSWSAAQPPLPFVTWNLLLSLVLLHACTEKWNQACVQPTLSEHRQDGSGWLLYQ